MNQLPDTTEHLLKAVMVAASPIFAESFSPDCCLNATRVLITVLQEFGVRAQPLSVKTFAANQIYVSRVRMGLDPLGIPEAWALGTDTQNFTGGSGWCGHLVAFVSERWLFDGSAGQMNRPEKDINIPQMFIAKWPRTAKKVTHREYELEGGGVLAYRSRPFDQSFRDLPGYQLHEQNKVVAARVVRKTQDMLQFTGNVFETEA